MSNSPESPDTEAIAARADAATPGPWIASHESVSDIHGFDCQSQVTYPDGQGNYGFAPADAEFIAAARTDIPALLAALASEKERADALEKERDDLRIDVKRAVADAYVWEKEAEAAEQVIAAAAELVALHDGREEHGPRISRAPTKREWGLLRLSLANYHTATTEPGAEP